MNKEEKNESKVIIENGKIKTIFSKEIENNGGWMSVDEFCRLRDESMDKLDEMIKIQSQNEYKSKQRSVPAY